ncbi:MAG: cation-transporting P-type ATPase [Myxococcota bacterium]|nr:cation-transporting P-type ATPase [Myxococcota bacterium]
MRAPIPPDRWSPAAEKGQPLSELEVEGRRARFGDNLIVEGVHRSLWRRIRQTAADPMLWFLVVTGGIYLALGERLEGLTLLLSVLPLTGMDAFLHRRTRASTEGLESRLAATARVRRDGSVQPLPAAQVVVGDRVEVAAGELVAADGVWLEVQGLQLEESSLTGEAYPVHKAAVWPEGLTGPGPWAVDTSQWGFAGTRVLTGSGSLRVLNTGADSLYGQIVRSARASGQARTPLQRSIASLVLVLSVVALALCVVLAAVRWLQGHGWVDALVSAATLAVAALPEEFPLVFTFFLGAGSYRLARRQALVRRAVTVENVGRVSTICADKTGTLTEGRLRLTRVVPAEGYAPEEVLTIAAGAARAESGDPLDAALLEELSRRQLTVPSSKLLATFPFTEERRRETAAWAGPDRIWVVTKGTPELILSLCGLTPPAVQGWMEEVERVAGTGQKPIGCARLEVDPAHWRGGEPTHGFIFAGLLVFADPVRAGVGESIARCRAAGLRTVMVTGDHPATALAVAREIGLGGDSPRLVLGSQLEQTPPADLRELDVVARALPAQKLLLVRALQEAGESVAVTGDGVNDVPALQAADVGLVMGERGTRSAREVASIVLLDDNFRTIVGAIAEGRQLFENLRDSFAYLLLIHIPLVLTAAFLPLAGQPLLYLPLHIVWLELIIHPTAMLSFQARPPDGRLLPRAHRSRFFSTAEWAVIAASGALTTVAVTLAYLRALGPEGGVLHARAMALTTLGICSACFGALLSRLRTRASRIVAGGTVLSTLVLLYLPPVPRLFHLQPLHLDDWGWVLAAAAICCLPLGLRGLADRRRRFA